MTKEEKRMAAGECPKSKSILDKTVQDFHTLNETVRSKLENCKSKILN